MPELPEVEVSRRGLLPHLCGQTIVGAVVRAPRLRHPIRADLAARLSGLCVAAIERRGKYLLFDCASRDNGGWLLVHLGMSGSLRLVAPGTPPQKHDHVDLCFAQTTLRLRDPRRFGALLWIEGQAITEHPLLAPLGVEPLSDAFDGDWLYAATRGRGTSIKALLMNSHVVVGIGNIYVAEALFKAGVSPLVAARRVGRERCHRLAAALRETLETSIAAGGSSIRDYVHSDGGAGSYQLACAVYGRAGQPCPACGGAIACVRQGGRSSFYCRRCQR